MNTEAFELIYADEREYLKETAGNEDMPVLPFRDEYEVDRRESNAAKSQASFSRDIMAKEQDMEQMGEMPIIQKPTAQVSMPNISKRV